MHVNNEIGVIQDIAAIGDLLKEKGIIFHGRCSTKCRKIGFSHGSIVYPFIIFIAHKIYGPKG